MSYVSDEAIAYLIIFGVMAVIVIAIGLIYMGFEAGTVSYVTDTVKAKWIKSTSGGSQKYLISTENNGVFENTDGFNFIVDVYKYTSSDFYANIEVGKKYKFKTIGWRLPFWSSYKNIVEFEEVEEE